MKQYTSLQINANNMINEDNNVSQNLKNKNTENSPVKKKIRKNEY